MSQETTLESFIGLQKLVLSITDRIEIMDKTLSAIVEASETDTKYKLANNEITANTQAFLVLLTAFMHSKLGTTSLDLVSFINEIRDNKNAPSAVCDAADLVGPQLDALIQSRKEESHHEVSAKPPTVPSWFQGVIEGGKARPSGGQDR